MHTITSAFAVTVLLALSTNISLAQSPSYSGPSNSNTRPANTSRYSGPSSVPLMTVEQLLNTGHDDQYARLQGRIVSHDGGEYHTFEDATGRITVEIDDKDFPSGQTISAEQKIEVLGEFDKGLRKVELEVDRITLLP